MPFVSFDCSPGFVRPSVSRLVAILPSCGNGPCVFGSLSLSVAPPSAAGQEQVQRAGSARVARLSPARGLLRRRRRAASSAAVGRRCHPPHHLLPCCTLWVLLLGALVVHRAPRHQRTASSPVDCASSGTRFPRTVLWSHSLGRRPGPSLPQLPPHGARTAGSFRKTASPIAVGSRGVRMSHGASSEGCRML